MSEHWVTHIGSWAVNMDTVTTMWIAMAVLILFALLATRKLALIPNKLQALAEGILGAFYGLTDMMIGGKEGAKHVPLVASLFLFILVSNLMGQLPWKLYHLKAGEFASPTNDINLTGALAIIVLIYYVFAGIRKKGFKLIFHGFGFDKIILTLVDLLEMITRPLTLALRLFGNVLAGEILITALIGIFAYLLPLPIMIFELLVATVQALVFTMLTLVYVSSAVSDEH
ncbi:MAG: F0F1 ATP synthase subunit A [Candidatus Gastranaerophilales bacterium]|nr:F0F1 ATP synthase subunit A [Candidatus Gastranaerophilales bacterium]